MQAPKMSCAMSFDLSPDNLLPFQQRVFLNHVAKQKQLLRQKPSNLEIPEIALISKRFLQKRHSMPDQSNIHLLNKISESNQFDSPNNIADALSWDKIMPTDQLRI